MRAGAGRIAAVGPRAVSEVNSTKLRVRIAKYLKAQDCGRGRQNSGASVLSRAACNDPGLVHRFQKGTVVSDAKLRQIDEYLRKQGY